MSLALSICVLLGIVHFTYAISKWNTIFNFMLLLFVTVPVVAATDIIHLTEIYALL